jgi:hypothetical protein
MSFALSARDYRFGQLKGVRIGLLQCVEICLSKISEICVVAAAETIEEAKKRLETQFSAEELARRVHVYRQIERALQEQLNKISQMAQEQVEFWLREWIEPGVRLISIDKFVASQVIEVDFAGATSGTTLPFTASILGKLHCTVKAPLSSYARHSSSSLSRGRPKLVNQLLRAKDSHPRWKSPSPLI